MTTYPIDPPVSGPGQFMVEINPDAGTARLVPMAEVQRLRDADVDQHVILPDVQRDLARAEAEIERLTGIQRNGDWPKYLDARTRMIEAEAENERLRGENRMLRATKLNGRVPCVSCGREISAGYMRDEGLRCVACEAKPDA